MSFKIYNSCILCLPAEATKCTESSSHRSPACVGPGEGLRQQRTRMSLQGGPSGSVSRGVPGPCMPPSPERISSMFSSAPHVRCPQDESSDRSHSKQMSMSLVHVTHQYTKTAHSKCTEFLRGLALSAMRTELRFLLIWTSVGGFMFNRSCVKWHLQ